MSILTFVFQIVKTSVSPIMKITSLLELPMPTVQWYDVMLTEPAYHGRMRIPTVFHQAVKQHVLLFRRYLFAI